MQRDEVRRALTGPVASQAVPFGRDGEIDREGLAAGVEFNLAAGSPTILLTYGDSLYSLLTDAEVAEVTRLVCEQVAGRALVVAACHEYATPAAVQFAQYCSEVGADVLMLMPPGWGNSLTPETYRDHFLAVGEHLPLMMVTNVFARRSAAFGLACLDALLDENVVVAVKDDFLGEFGRKMCLQVHERWAVIAGGQKQNHLGLHPYGCDGYLSTFISFRPEIAHRYWAAIRADDMVAARSVIRDHDMPYFDYAIGATGGFDAVFHGALELAGVCGRWRRPPYYSLSDEEMERLGDLLARIG